MSFKSFFNQKVQKMDWIDIALIKWSCIAFGIVIAILIPELRQIDVRWFVGAVIIFAIRPIYRAYIK